jgi:hypothetical protein
MHDNCLEMINPNSAFQWYDLNSLWQDINNFISKNTKLVNLVNEPLESSAIIDLFANKKVGDTPSPQAKYDIKTIHMPSGYLKDKGAVLADIKRFICA